LLSWVPACAWFLRWHRSLIAVRAHCDAPGRRPPLRSAFRLHARVDASLTSSWSVFPGPTVTARTFCRPPTRRPAGPTSMRSRALRSTAD